MAQLAKNSPAFDDISLHALKRNISRKGQLNEGKLASSAHAPVLTPLSHETRFVSSELPR